MDTYFSGDLHCGHSNIIIYTNRPFLKKGDLTKDNKWINPFIAKERCKEMDAFIIRNINEKVKESDTLIVNGDFCFSKSTEASEAPKKAFNYYRDQINCKNIIFLEGNHDRNNTVKTRIQKLTMKIGGKRICILHDPEYCDTNYEINLTAHVHQNWQIKRYRKGMTFTDAINVGVDVWDFRPCTWEQIWQRYSKWLKNEKTN